MTPAVRLGHLSDAGLREALWRALAWGLATRKNELLHFNRDVLWALTIDQFVPPQVSAAEQKAIHQALDAECRRLSETPGGGPHREYPDARRLLAATWQLVADGVAYPRLREVMSGEHASIEYLVVTALGQRALDAGGLHPLAPGFVTRMQSGCTTIPDDVIARIQDAADCLRHGLLRASVVMLGLAFEEEVSSLLRARLGVATKLPHNAVDRLAKLRTMLDATGTKEERHRGAVAIGVAETIRDQRNRASHPGSIFDDREEVEELLRLGAHQIRALEHLRVATSSP